MADGEFKIHLNDAPTRRFEATIIASGDTLRDLALLLRHFVDQIEGGGPDGITGGYASGGVFRVSENPGMTHERYDEEITKYLATHQKEVDTSDVGNPPIDHNASSQHSGAGEKI